ncbi:amidase [Marinilactibacillus sp. XAAS-LB27]|uniref:amidase n=1 Tax=Marinilactibacillus sp. XAAS-LB27 TaxID=3114538 RepID=UPI002E1900BD|nr:amidase [Marinilactibacillus sp. XAAS-LB27]
MTKPFDRTQDGLYFADLVSKRHVSPEELIEESFKQIEQQNPLLNAVISTRKEAALKEARSRKFAGLPFGGVPILLKGLGQNLEGEPATSGARILKDVKAKKTAHFVTDLKKAGFIPIGHTNIPEFGFTNITNPELYGPAKNPWSKDRTPGGSSGGAAAAVASNMTPVAGASDGGGSIRIPASFTGLVGLKPTRGRTAVGPGNGRGWQGASISFALTKSVRDTAALLDAVQVVQPQAAFQTPLFEAGYRSILNDPFVRPLKIAVNLTAPSQHPISEEAIKAVKDAANWFESKGYQVVEATPDIDTLSLMKSYYAMNAGETAAVFEELEQSFGTSFSLTDMELMTWTLLQAGKKLPAATYARALAEWDHAAESYHYFHQEYDILLEPATADVAPKVDRTYWSDSLKRQMEHTQDHSSDEAQQIIWDMFTQSWDVTPFTQHANLTGQPAISLPTHLTPEGLPLGIQLTAPKGQEHLLLQIGQQMELDGQFI